MSHPTIAPERFEHLRSRLAKLVTDGEAIRRELDAIAAELDGEPGSNLEPGSSVEPWRVIHEVAALLRRHGHTTRLDGPQIRPADEAAAALLTALGVEVTR